MLANSQAEMPRLRYMELTATGVTGEIIMERQHLILGVIDKATLSPIPVNTTLTNYEYLCSAMFPASFLVDPVRVSQPGKRTINGLTNGLTYLIPYFEYPTN